MDLGILTLIIWMGCFVIVAFDSAMNNISPVFWRLAALFGGPFALAAYGISRERQ